LEQFACVQSVLTDEILAPGAHMCDTDRRTDRGRDRQCV